ncbi:hypothetical protein [Lactobacillus iners]|uniref:hypothetical protein n=1 Tax=Lactobacillus iners TaxID=147802 RepID=UPI0001E9A2EE|nr:hypothetical protein [Lactobacillus iners]EFQ47336.1 hypothetical protein HMPREF9216_0175 [Lactobacillus iners LEAF 2053A-b]
MEIIQKQACTMIGKVFLPTDIDEQRSYAAAIQQVENDINFVNFLKENNLEHQRAALYVFAPDSFMYWYGVVVHQLPNEFKGLRQFGLPSCKVANYITESQNLTHFLSPVNQTIPMFLDKLNKENVTYHENLGESDVPYILEELDLDTKKLTQSLYLDASDLSK